MTRQALFSILSHTLSASDNLFSDYFYPTKNLPGLPCSQEVPIQKLKKGKNHKRESKDLT